MRHQNGCLSKIDRIDGLKMLRTNMIDVVDGVLSELEPNEQKRCKCLHVYKSQA